MQGEDTFSFFLRGIIGLEGHVFCSGAVTLGGCCSGGLLDRRLLVQPLLRLQHRVLELGFLVDVAATHIGGERLLITRARSHLTLIEPTAPFLSN